MKIFYKEIGSGNNFSSYYIYFYYLREISIYLLAYRYILYSTYVRFYSVLKGIGLVEIYRYLIY